MELLQYWRIIQKRLLLIVLLVAVGVGSTAFYTLRQPVTYESTATLLLNPAVPSSLVPYVQSQVAPSLADSYAELLRSQSFAEKVVKALPFALGPGEVVGAVSTRLVPNTLFFKISAELDSPERAQRLVTTVVSVFLSANAAQQQAQADGGADSLRARMRVRLSDKLAYLGEQIKNYQSQLDDLQKQAVSVERDAALLQLRGQLVSLQQTETDTIVALGQLDDGSSLASTALVVDAAGPGLPGPSRLLTNLLLALALSLALGGGLAFLLDYLDNTVRTPEQLEAALGLAPLGVLGVIGGSGRRGRPAAAGDGLGGRNLIMLDAPKSAEAESFRILRTNIQFSSLDQPLRSLVVTSAGPAEGKSFMAANLALVLAGTGKRVILVDTDLRRPSLHRLFNLPNGTGFTSLLLGEGGGLLGVAAAVPGVPTLRVIPSGPLPPNPAELLGAHQAAAVMEMLAAGADMVIYDTPPAAAVTDAVILAARVDGVVFVVSAGSTRRDMVARARKSLRQVGVRALIPVLNRVAERDLAGSYYYYQYKGYGSGDTPASGGPPAANGNGTAAHANGNGAAPNDRAARRRSGKPAPALVHPIQHDNQDAALS